MYGLYNRHNNLAWIVTGNVCTYAPLTAFSMVSANVDCPTRVFLMATREELLAKGPGVYGIAKGLERGEHVPFLGHWHVEVREEAGRLLGVGVVIFVIAQLLDNAGRVERNAR